MTIRWCFARNNEQKLGEILYSRRNFFVKPWNGLPGRLGIPIPGGVQELTGCGTQGSGLAEKVVFGQGLDSILLEGFPALQCCFSLTILGAGWRAEGFCGYTCLASADILHKHT